MEKETKTFIAELARARNKSEILNSVMDKHKFLKEVLIEAGVKFIGEDSIFFQDISGDHTFYGIDEISEAKLYEEINYIRCGLLGKWTTNISDVERFNQIKKQVLSII